jgi:hypothetical protein
MMTGFEQYTRKRRRAIFLEEMERVPLGAMIAASTSWQTAKHQSGYARRSTRSGLNLRGVWDGGCYDSLSRRWQRLWSQKSKKLFGHTSEM